MIETDLRGAGRLAEARPAVGADRVESLYGLTGRGVRVGMLDTGFDTDHPDLQDAIAAQHCFVKRGCPPFNRNESLGSTPARPARVVRPTAAMRVTGPSPGLPRRASRNPCATAAGVAAAARAARTRVGSASCPSRVG
jgi:subtilisin family serine protease